MTSMDNDYDLTTARQTIAEWNNESTAYLSRYYTLYHHLTLSVYVRQAPNKICVLGLRQDHPFLTAHSTENEVRLNQRLDCGSKVTPDTVICELIVGDHVQEIKACMHGKLLEVNQRIPELIGTRFMDIGFIAVIMPRWEDSEKQLNEFVNKDL
ncbi:hypothetical protein DFQ28_004721 [Apophysomyces sp. BC1034]|nr:hypothetical protein DFQ30_008625 [Apophysomyces sp. BC1015]KAG0181016.1 hypothetical protein DFQ29_009550 [Apophysomyces sp. BC1021]KAG0188538.1 hypothetical protein DFQ28_004721 [Apophysomyces sp. BC1034]